MSLCVCMCVCLYVSVCGGVSFCLFVCMYVCMYVSMYVCMYVCLSICLSVYLSVCGRELIKESISELASQSVSQSVGSSINYCHAESCSKSKVNTRKKIDKWQELYNMRRQGKGQLFVTSKSFCPIYVNISTTGWVKVAHSSTNSNNSVKITNIKVDNLV